MNIKLMSGEVVLFQRPGVVLTSCRIRMSAKFKGVTQTVSMLLSDVTGTCTFTAYPRSIWLYLWILFVIAGMIGAIYVGSSASYSKNAHQPWLGLSFVGAVLSLGWMMLGRATVVVSSRDGLKGACSFTGDANAPEELVNSLEAARLMATKVSHHATHAEAPLASASKSFSASR